MEISNIKLKECTLEKYPELLSVLDTEFKKEYSHWFVKNLQQIFPEIEEKDTKKISKHLILENEKEIMGIIGVYPLELSIAEESEIQKFKIGGIGSVSVVSKYRNQGVMSSMLTQAIKFMEEQNYDLAWLSGDRFRYGNYGWDLAGKNYNIKIAYRDLLRYKYKKLNISINQPTNKDIKILDSLYSNFDNRQIRDEKSWEVHIKRQNYNWLLAKNNNNYAYLAATKNYIGHICEIQGNPEVVINLITEYMKNNNLQYVYIDYPSKKDKVFDTLMKITSSYSVSLNGLLRIINLDNTWNKLFSLLKQQLVYKYNKEYFDEINRNNDLKKKEIIIKKMLDIFHPDNNMDILRDVKSVNWWMSDVDKI